MSISTPPQSFSRDSKRSACAMHKVRPMCLNRQISNLSGQSLVSQSHDKPFADCIGVSGKRLKRGVGPLTGF